MSTLAASAFSDRGGTRSSNPASAPGTLSQPILRRLAICAARYQKQAALPTHRRRRVGILVRGASTTERLAIAAFFAHRLALRMSLLDAAIFEGAHDDDAADYARPLYDDAPSVALVEGITFDLDRRLRDALVRSSRSVLVVACVESDESLDSRLKACFPFIVDGRAKVRSLPLVSALRV